MTMKIFQPLALDSQKKYIHIASFVGAFSCVASGIAMIFIIVRALLFGDPTSGLFFSLLNNINWTFFCFHKNLPDVFSNNPDAQ
jgi:hypothetical protein